MISFKAHRDRLREAKRVELLQDIQLWENLNKKQVSAEVKRAYEQLKLIDAHGIAQSMLYANHRVFDYGNKVSKQLARVLADKIPVKGDSALRSLDGGLTKDIRGKFEVFVDYCQDLYALQEGQQGLWEPFFDSFEIPVITSEQVALMEAPFTGDKILVAID